MTVRGRAARVEDVDGALDLFIGTLRDMLARNGIDPGELHRDEWRYGYAHVFRTGIFRVAEDDGELVAICHAIVRGPLWFLSGFWTRPDRQRTGIGGSLLREVWDEGRDRGAATFFTWSSIDLTAMASYLRRSMLPGFPILSFVGEPAPTTADGSDVAPLTLESAATLDRDVIGTTRALDHGFWLTEPGRVGRAVVRDGRTIGYYYARGGGVGPAAWASRADADLVLGRAIADARVQSPTVRLRALGASHDTIRFALSRGLRLAGYSHLLTTAPFGHLDRYVPSGPTLF
ncbi:MAG TPA: GNAT family N-acetyltransferase [Candidatus Limnocylindria bacterium]|jgi:GNAT superfamily N-acetyltransferase|nr:GNAT family N-acetyltransferase [Candidatus Limnocylindria bacterium]